MGSVGHKKPWIADPSGGDCVVGVGRKGVGYKCEHAALVGGIRWWSSLTANRPSGLFAAPLS